MRARALALSAVLTAVVIAGCGSSSAAKKVVKPTTVDASVIAHAAAKAATQPGYAFNLDANISATQIGGSASATGTASVLANRPVGALNLHVTPPGNLAALGSLATKVIITDGKLYVQIPSSLANVIPNVKPWLSATLSDLASQAGQTIPGLTSSSPQRVFTMLAKDSTGKAQSFGTETIAGQKTTHYREKLSTGSSSKPLTVDMWVADSTGLPRRIRAAFDSTSDTVRATLTFTSFSVQSSPTAPKQSGSLSALISQALKTGL